MRRGLSARKRDRQNAKRRLKSRATKSRLRTTVKKASSEPTTENLRESYSLLDKAVKAGAMHRRTAARMKSNLARGTAPQKSD